MLTIIDENPRECLAIEADRKLNSQNVMDVLSQLFIEHGNPHTFVQIMARNLLQRGCTGG